MTPLVKLHIYREIYNKIGTSIRNKLLKNVKRTPHCPSNENVYLRTIFHSKCLSNDASSKIYIVESTLNFYIFHYPWVDSTVKE